eukprot:2663850-Prymnesium_polylepis.1
MRRGAARADWQAHSGRSQCARQGRPEQAAGQVDSWLRTLLAVQAVRRRARGGGVHVHDWHVRCRAGR